MNNSATRTSGNKRRVPLEKERRLEVGSGKHITAKEVFSQIEASKPLAVTENSD